MEAAWKKDVMAFYKERIANRYPFNKTADKEVALADFTEFFGVGGRLDEYIVNYLKPFVDTNGVKWQWRKVNDRDSLNIPDAVLVQLQRASIISKMFFVNKKLEVSLSVEPLSTSAVEAPVLLNWPADAEKLQRIFPQLDVKGSWAVFKLLDKGRLEHLTGPGHFEWILTVNGKPVHYEILMARAMNPLIGGIVDQFRLPEGL
jgi:type VI protein secretion system component VasK